MMCVKNKAVMAVVVSAAVLLPASAGAQSSGSPVQVERIDNPSLAEHLVTPVRVWRNPAHDPRAVVLLIHGFPEHGLLYEKLATKLVEAGYIVYAPDMRGLGRAYSTGAATKISYVRHGDDDLIRLAELLHQNHKGLPLFVGGESMGGAFAIRLAAQHPELVDGV